MNKMAENKTVLECRDLKKIYKEGSYTTEILKGINFKVNSGDMVAIIGASGSGKSTLLQLLGGLDVPNQGEVLVNGQPINQLSEKDRARLRNRSLGFVYQFHHLLPEFSALENVVLPLLIGKMKTHIAKQKASEILDRVGLSSHLHYPIGKLSGGERQRVAIARALVTEPSCVLADEPTGNLDQTTADQAYKLMLELNRVFNTCFIVVTHNPELAAHMERTLVLKNGYLEPYQQIAHSEAKIYQQT